MLEVLVALFILAIVLTASAAIIVTGFRTVKDNMDRSYAANIARSEIQRLEALDPRVITLGVTTSKKVTSFATYSVRTSAQWTALGDTQNVCESDTTGQAYLAVHVEVTGGRLEVPQEASTIITPDNAIMQPDKGSLLIKVTDELGDPAGDVNLTGVNILDQADRFTLTTAAQGCILIPGLANNSNWRITATRPSWVSPENSYTPVITSGVRAQQTTSVSFTLGFASGLTLQPSDPAFPIPSVINQYWIESTFMTKTKAPVTTWPAEAFPLFPSDSGYIVTFGGCDVKPGAEYGQRFDVDPGAYTQAELVGVEMNMSGITPGAVVNAIRAADPTGGLCSTTQTLKLGKADAKGTLKVTVPFGSWMVTPADGSAGKIANAPRAETPTRVDLVWGYSTDKGDEENR